MHTSIQLQTIDSPSEDSKYTGVWTHPTHKIASIGVQVRHRVTSHGFALNVHTTSLEGFRKIVACGLPDVQLTCIDEQLAWQGRESHVSVQQVAGIVADEFGSTFKRNIEAADNMQFFPQIIDGMKVLSHVMVDAERISLD